MNTRPLNLIVVSPSDVGDERNRVRDVIDELNVGIAGEMGLRLAVWLWETDAYPAVHISGGQGHIDDLMRIESSDVVIGIFWKRFGTSLTDSQSGTEHRLQKAMTSWTETKRPEIMLYFNFARYFPDKESELEQARRVTHFREHLSSQALWWKYDGPDDFERQLRRNLTAWLRKKFHRQDGETYSEAAKVIEYYSCFLSYSSKDDEFARRLYNDLQGKNVRTWFAPEHLKIGDRFRSRIDEFIRIHDKVVLILSANSVASDWVETEVESVIERERKEGKEVLFPIAIDEEAFTSQQSWAADIRRKRHIGDFRKWKSHDDYTSAFDRLVRDLKKSQPPIIIKGG